MSQSKNDVLKDLNTLLQGTAMGINTYKDYLSACQAVALKKTLSDALKVFEKHKNELEKHIQSLESQYQTKASIKEAIAEFFEKIKAELADNDRTLLDYAIKGIDMALKAVQDFKKKHHGLQHDCLKAIDEMEKDYRKIYQDLIDLKLDKD